MEARQGREGESFPAHARPGRAPGLGCPGVAWEASGGGIALYGAPGESGGACIPNRLGILDHFRRNTAARGYIC